MSDPKPPILPAPPNIFLLFTRNADDDSARQDWDLEQVVGFDARDGRAYIVGGMNSTGALVRADDVLEKHRFRIVRMWQEPDGEVAARKRAEYLVETLFNDALPYNPDDPRRRGQ